MRGRLLLRYCCFLVTFLLISTTITFAQKEDYDSQTNLLEKVINELIVQKRQFDEQELLYQPDTDSEDSSDEGEWVVKVIGGLENAIKIANETNTKLQRQVRGFDDIYVFERNYEPGSRQKRSRGELASHLTHMNVVSWAEHQREKRRTKRAPLMMNPPNGYLSMFNDPLWPQQWQMHNFNTSKKGDMRIIEAWGLGVTGKGVVVSILDDGIDHQHPDLAPNYEPQGSYDLNDNDFDPMPTRNEDNKHGTRCAGEVSMVANNGICGVGVAYNAKIAGVRMLDGRITDRLEGEALAMGIETVDIYSASWGPNDDGKTVEGPGRLALLGLIKGIKYGRQGKGSIYVWASGNGGMNKDDCNCDGYTSSLFSFSVASAAEDGTFPWYAESCPSTITTTYSSGARGQRMISTVDTMNRCTTSHSGTSASAPIAAGVIALALEANPSLTWRDVQHLGVWTSNPAPLLRANEGWHMNGVGLIMNSKFGFGLMDAYEFVRQAKTWQNVPPQRSCATYFPGFIKRDIASQVNTVLTFTTDGCAGLQNEINYIEHVQLIADINHNNRGRLEIWLTSPAGTRTRLLKPRINDNSDGGFPSWPFSNLHNWGENPRGQWQLKINDMGQLNSPSSGVINNITLIIYGTKEPPAHYSQIRNYTDIDFNKLEIPSPNPTPTNPPQNPWFSPIPSAVSKRSAEILNEYETNPKFRDLLRRDTNVFNTVLNELMEESQNSIRQRRKTHYFKQKEFISK